MTEICYVPVDNNEVPGAVNAGEFACYVVDLDLLLMMMLMMRRDWGLGRGPAAFIPIVFGSQVIALISWPHLSCKPCRLKMPGFVSHVLQSYS